MKRKKLLLLLCFLNVSIILTAQNKFTVNGYIRDAQTGEGLINATIYSPTGKIGCVSNNYGYYNLIVPKGENTLSFSYVGYETQKLQLNLHQDTTISIFLNQNNEVEQVTVKASLIKRSPGPGTINLPMKQIEALPTLLGEKDVLKAIQLLPGVQTGHEGSTGIMVRGGGPDQNLILLDGVTVFNVSHLLGFSSVFIPEAIKGVTLIKGGFPARYGGRLSSVLDIRMKEGNEKKYTGSFSLGLLSSKFTFEGPIVKDKSSFIISARRSYFDLLMRPFMKSITGEAGSVFGYYFYDLNAKLNYKINNKNKLYFSFYTGRDRVFARNQKSEADDFFSEESKSRYELLWGNRTMAFRWNSIYSNRLFSNTTITYNTYKYKLFSESDYKYTDESTNYSSYIFLGYDSKVTNYGVRYQAEYYPVQSYNLVFGGSLLQYSFTPANNKYNVESTGKNVDFEIGAKNLLANEASLFVENRLILSENRWESNLGLHFLIYKQGRKNYYSLQPRLLLKYWATVNTAVSGSFSTMMQPVLLLVNSGAGLPTDSWVPSTERVSPQQSWQTSLGISHAFSQVLSGSVDLYYKQMENLVEYKEGVNFMDTRTDWEDKIEIGQGKAFGAEFFLHKKEGRTNGWIAYTLSKSDRTFEKLNEGKTFPFKYDRRHDFKTTVIYKFRENIHLSALFVFSTGNVLTVPTANYQVVNEAFNFPVEDFFSAEMNFDQNMVDYYPARNNFRMPEYHRLDLGVDFIKKKRRGVRTWNFSIYNVYSRKNLYFIYYEKDSKTDEIKIKATTLLPIFPSITYSFKFK
ncbi:MAG: TonB-dependent receptor [Bacteroidota bacterium]